MNPSSTSNDLSRFVVGHDGRMYHRDSPSALTGLRPCSHGLPRATPTKVPPRLWRNRPAGFTWREWWRWLIRKALG